MTSIRFPGDVVSVSVHEIPWIAPGTVYVDSWAARIITRHLSEALLWVGGATWHPAGDRCPTWTDAAECRCMVDP